MNERIAAITMCAMLMMPAMAMAAGMGAISAAEIGIQQEAAVGEPLRLISDSDAYLRFEADRTLPGELDVNRHRAINLDFNAISAVWEGQHLLLNLFDDAAYAATVDDVAISPVGTVTVRARLDGYEYGYMLLSMDGNACTGLIEIPERGENYLIRSVPYESCQLLLDIKDFNYVQTDVLEPEAERVQSPQNAQIRDGPMDPAVVDVMVVYTPAARDWAEENGGGINSVISQAISLGNLALDNSDTYMTFNLVHTYQVDYVESGDSTTDLCRLTFHEGYDPWDIEGEPRYMEEVHYLRDTHGADLVTLFSLAHDVGGLAWLLGNPDGYPEMGFSLVRVQQAGWTFTHGHEMGHNMGLHHHKEQNVQPGPGIFDYSAGWRWTGTEGGKFCSVMTYEGGSYFDDGQYHTRVAHFSNPDILYQGEPTGHALDGDNARTLRETKHVVAAYREATPYRCNLSPDISSGYGEPGSAVHYSMTVRNDGLNDDTFILDYRNNDLPWPVTFHDSEMNPITTLGPLSNMESMDFVAAVHIPAGASPGEAEISDIIATSMGNPDIMDAARIRTGMHTPILLVDDDFNIDSAKWYTDALEAGGYAYNHWDTNVLGSPALSDLQAHDAAVWFTGNVYGNEDQTLTAIDRTNIEAYLSGGGNMYLSGSLIEYDAYIINGWGAWFEAWFHAKAVDPGNFGGGVGDFSRYPQTIYGYAGDPIMDGLTIHPHSGDYCTELWGYFTVNDPVGSGSSSAYYSPGLSLGHDGAFVRADTGTYRTVFSAFDFAETRWAETRATLMDRIVTWLLNESGETPEPPPGAPTELAVNHYGEDSIREIVANGIFMDGHSPWTLSRPRNQGESTWDGARTASLDGSGSVTSSASLGARNMVVEEESIWEQSFTGVSRHLTLSGAYAVQASTPVGNVNYNRAIVEIGVHDTGNSAWHVIYSSGIITGSVAWTDFGPDVTYTPFDRVIGVRVRIIVEVSSGGGRTQPSASIQAWVDNISLSVLEEGKNDHNELRWLKSPDDGAGLDNVDCYIIHRAVSETGPWDSESVIDTVPAGTVTYIDPGRGLADEINWWYVVRASDIHGNHDDNINAVPEISMEPPESPVELSVEHGGSAGRVIVNETRHMRADGSLDITQSGTEQQSLNEDTGAGGHVANWGMRVWAGASEITGGLPVALVSRNADGLGLQSAAWDCPETVLGIEDAVVIRIYSQVGGGDWVQQAVFMTEGLGSDRLEMETWNVHYHTHYETRTTGQPAQRYTRAWFHWGSDDANSMVENFRRSVRDGESYDHNILNWTHSGRNVERFNIYRSEHDSDGYSLIDTVPADDRSYLDIMAGRADDIRWWYMVRAENANGEEQNRDAVREPGGSVYAIDLTGRSAGEWAFVSFPIDISGDIGEILNDPDTTWDVAKWHDPASKTWKTYRRGSGVNTFARIDNTMGVWVRLTAIAENKMNTGFTGDFPAAAVNIQLYAGWNMVGYPSATDRPASDTLPAEADTVAIWQATSPYILDRAANQVTMAHGNAYWVRVTADCVWSVEP